MRRINQTFSAVIILVFAFAGFASAQMMGGGNHGNMMMKSADSTSASQMMNSDMMSRMQNMSGTYEMTISDFNKLESHFNKMMQITDMATLKAEMQKHQSMMRDMHNNMIKQESAIRKMMSTSEKPSDMQGMMKVTNTEEKER